MQSRNDRARRARSARNFRLEPLERRELLAADMQCAGMLPADDEPALMGPLTPEQVASEQVVSDQVVSDELTAGEPVASQTETSSVTASLDTMTASTHRRRRDRQPGTQNPDTPIPDAQFEPRSFDGTGNNLDDPLLGSTGEQLLRVAPADYGDGISSLAGADRPSPREISNALAAQDPDAEGNERGASAFLYVWGQFIDHDIDLSEVPHAGGEAADISVPTGDPLFDPDATGEEVIPFTRSLFDPATGDSTANPREQFNAITAWIDGSQVYGSDQATADSLREFAGGRLLMGDDGLLPVDEEGNFLSGDVRVNENIELTTMHTLFAREHNFWADQIAAENPSLTDEQIYQQARSLVVAEMQSITFNEFLPALLGDGAIAPYAGYNPSVNPNIANEFSTAAFRLGHSLLNDDIEFFGDDGRAVRDEVALAEAFFHPDLLRETGIDSVLKYVASSQSQEIDNQIVDSVRNFLFGAPGAGGLDLASLNIQRGRDHGLADYNAVREAYGLARVEDFAGITGDVGLQQTLEDLYGDVDNIDLWVGALAEDHVEGSGVGELVQTIVADQFTRLRDGDRLWYENIFSDGEVAQIENTTLSDIIQRNSSVTNLQRNVFFMNAEVRGQVFADADGSGSTGRGEPGIAGVTVELLDDEGEVVDTTITDGLGRYAFGTFHETGDYQVRVVPRVGMPLTTGATVDVLISRGGEVVQNIDFGVGGPLDGGGNDGGGNRDRDRRDRDGRGGRTRAVDSVMADLATRDMLDAMADALDDNSLDNGARPSRRRG